MRKLKYDGENIIEVRKFLKNLAFVFGKNIVQTHEKVFLLESGQTVSVNSRNKVSVK